MLGPSIVTECGLGFYSENHFIILFHQKSYLTLGLLFQGIIRQQHVT